MTCCTCLCAVAALLPSLLLLVLLLPLPTPFSHLFARSSAQLLDPPRCGCSIIFANPFGYVASNKFSSVLVLLLHLPLLLLLLLFCTSDGKAIFPAFTPSRIASPLTTLLSPSLFLTLSISVPVCLCLCYEKWGATNLGLSWHVLLPLLRFFRIHFDCLSYFYEIISIASTGLRFFAPYLCVSPPVYCVLNFSFSKERNHLLSVCLIIQYQQGDLHRQRQK